MISQEKLRIAGTLGPVVVDVSGPTLDETDIARLRHPSTGMAILFSRNYSNPAQLAALCGAIHGVRPGIPIAVDHEGGRVQRFREGFAEMPAMSRIAELPSETRCAAFWAAGYVLAAELRSCGVDLTFAPVLDLDYGRSEIIGSRALGRDPESVTANARAFMRGLAEAGMAACGKHFPGHGWASADSHSELPVDERSFEALARDMKPYRELALELPSIMTAHIAYEAFEGEVATYAPALLQDCLRGEIGYPGLVFSDDLSMKGAAGGSPVERAERALASGCDMVLLCNDRPASESLLAGLSWHRGEAFNERLARLLPEPGDALSLDELRLTALYRAARDTLERAGFADAFPF